MITRTEKYKNKLKRLSANKVYWITVGVLAIGTLGITGSVLHHYSSSLNWTKATNTSVPLAKQSIDMLYDKSSQSRKAKMEFVSLYHDMINSDGSLNRDEATPMNIAKVKSLYKQFNASSDPANYQRKYGELLLKYSIQEQLDNLFTDDSDTSLENNVTPTQVAKFNNSTYNDLSSLYAQNSNDAFVKHIIQVEEELNNDIQTLNDIAGSFDKAFSIGRTTVTLADGYHDNITDEFNQKMTSLRFDWQSTNYIKRVVQVMNPILKWTMNKYNQHEIYIKDLQAKSSAFANWQNEQKQFFAKVQAIHDAAVEAQRQAQAAKAAQKARQDKQDYDEGQGIGKQDADNDAFNNNFDGKSDKYKLGYMDGYNAEKSKKDADEKSSQQQQQSDKNSNDNHLQQQQDELAKDEQANHDN